MRYRPIDPIIENYYHGPASNNTVVVVVESDGNEN